MSRIVTLSLTLKLELASRLERDYFYDGLEHMLRTGLGEVLAESPGCVTVIGAEDPEHVLTRATDLRSVLDPAGETAIVWSVADVLGIRPNLSREQASEVLHHFTDQHDANYGLSWGDLEFFAEELFGSEPEPELAAIPPT